MNSQNQYFKYMYSDDEKSSYRKFAQKTRLLSDGDLFKVNNNLVADQLTSEMKDIVAWEIRIREIETLKKHGIDVNEVNNYKHVNSEVTYKQDSIENGFGVSADIARERELCDGMTDDLLKQSMKIIEANPRVIDYNDPNLHNKNGGGINVMTKNFLIRCKNGEMIEVNNEAIQEHFRKEYIKRMSEITGIDYTQYDLNRGSEIYGGYESDYKVANKSSGPSMSSIDTSDVDYSDYEDDDDDD